MPYVNIRITRDGATREQKERLIEGVTGLLRDILGKNPRTTVVVIDEVDTDNWGIDGETVTERRKRQNPESRSQDPGEKTVRRARGAGQGRGASRP